MRPTRLWSCAHVRVPCNRAGRLNRETLLQTLSPLRWPINTPSRWEPFTPVLARWATPDSARAGSTQRDQSQALPRHTHEDV